MIEKSSDDAEKVHKASLTFQREMRTIAVGDAQRSLSHQKEKRDDPALGHDTGSVIDVEATQIHDAVPVENQPRPLPRMG